MVETTLLDLVEPPHELTRRRRQRSREAHDDSERGVALAALDFADVREADLGSSGEIGLSQLAPMPQLADPQAERAAQPRVGLLVRHDRIVRTTTGIR